MKKITAIFCMLIIGALMYAQGLTVRGTVRDSNGEPVVGAVVLLDGSANIAAITDNSGRYSITVPSVKSKLNISCISYKDQQVTVAGRASIDITLEDDNELLDEVVVVGYGAMRRSDLTGSVASVKINDDDAAKSATLDQMLEGRAAGVQVLSDSGSPDAGVTIRIRGISTFSGASDPLYVVDGVIIGGESEAVSTMTVGTSDNALEETNGLAGINPQDIASIEILKDASATAIYGSQGANGVVLITTKQASKDIPVIRFNAGVSVSNTDKRLDILNFDEYCQMLEVYPSETAQNRLKTIWKDPENRTGLLVTPIDWQDYIFRTAVGQRYYFSVSGRPKGYNYLFSLGYNHNEGIVIGSDSDNITARLNLEKQVNKRFKLSFKTSFGYIKSNLVTGSVNGGNVTSRSSLLRTTMRSKPYLLDNGANEEEDYDADADDDLNFGPSRWINGTTNTSERFRINPSLSGEYKFTKWLTFKSTFGGEFNSNERIKTKTALLSVGYGNLAGIGESQGVRFNWDNLLMINKKWGGHTISGTLGQTMSRVMNSTQSITGWFLPQAKAFEHDINNATSDYTKMEGFAESQSSLLSFFGRAIYNYKDRYVLTSTLRFDGSSKFQGANKWGIFPSFAFAWRITNEPWFNVPIISNAKLRLGWGQVGNQAIGNYQTRPTYRSSTLGNHFNDSGKETSLAPSNISNADLKWETSNQINAGLDLSLWKGRFTFTADAYQKDTKDLLQSKSIPLSTGFGSIAINDGSIQNRGLEFSVDAVPLKIGNFEWGIGGNISFNRNTIIGVGASGNSGQLYLSADSEPVTVNFFYGSELQSSGDTNPLNIFIEGQSMGLFYGYVFDGIVQEGETGKGFTEGTTRGEGYSKYKDLDGNGYIDANDRTIIGDPLPNFTYGFNTSFSWKGLSLKVDFSGAYKFDIFNMNNLQDYSNLYSKNMRRDAFLKAWTPENRSNEWPQLSKGNDSQLSSRYVEDGSYLRISNIALSYSIPINKKKAKILHGLAFTASVGNPYIWTKYSGYNPANNSYGSNVRRMGVDLNSAPYPRSINFDVKFTF